jgi:hypothetical protein
LYTATAPFRGPRRKNVKTDRKPLRAALAFALLLASPLALARVTPEEAAHLGKDLTPIGAEQAANKDSSIPVWTPIKQEGKLSNEYPRDGQGYHMSTEKPIYTISAANMAQYADKLTEGHKLLLNRFKDSYKMNVYKSYRLVNFPDKVKQATIENALRSELKSPDEPSGAILGFPFPIPKSGAELIWNHKLKWRGESVRRYNNQMIVQPDGNFTLTKLVEDVKFYYASIDHPRPIGPGVEYLRYLSKTLAPPRLAGTIILVHERASTGTEGRNAWLYSPGLRRIRRAPTVCCDNPYEGTDGHQFYDQVDMFNGVLERYDWKLMGKKEMIISYDNVAIANNKTKYKDLARPKHLNQELPRYELHRVWIVEANIRPGTSHTFMKRRMYIDEDSWNIVCVDDYDNRGQLMQFQEGHMVTGANILSAGTVPEVIYHFDSGRYFVTAMFNEDEPYNFAVRYEDEMFTPAAVQKGVTK